MALWSNLFSMLADVRRHVEAGEQVHSFDDSERLRLGFRSEASVWEIGLCSVKSADPSNLQEEHFCELFRTLEGRRLLLKQFRRGQLRKTIWEHLKERS